MDSWRRMLLSLLISILLLGVVVLQLVPLLHLHAIPLFPTKPSTPYGLQ